MKPKVPVIETERLILRPVTVDDAEAVYVWASDPMVNRYVTYPRHQSVQDAVEWLEYEEKCDSHILWGVMLKADNDLIGTISLMDKHDNDTWELGYNYRRDCWGRGIGTEAAKAVVDYARECGFIRTVIATHDVRNPASGRIMEKCAMTFAGEGTSLKKDGSEKFNIKIYKIEMR